jgi:hypothetical protein
MTRLLLRQDAIDRLAGQARGRFVLRERERESAGDRSERPTGVVRIAPRGLRPAPRDEEPVFVFPTRSLPPGGENRPA